MDLLVQNSSGADIALVPSVFSHGMAPKLAATSDPAWADNALAYQIMFYLEKEIKKEQNDQGTNKVDLGPYALGTWATFSALLTLPVLRMETGFPAWSLYWFGRGGELGGRESESIR